MTKAGNSTHPLLNPLFHFYMNKEYKISEDDLTYVLEQCPKLPIESAFGLELQKNHFGNKIKQYHKEYMASIEMGLTTKNYTEKEKAYYSALSIMKDNGIDILPAQFCRKPSDIAYSADFFFRKQGVEDKDFRRSVQYLVTGKEGRVPRVSDSKDKEIACQEEERAKTRDVLWWINQSVAENMHNILG